MGETEKALGGENRNGHFVVTLQNLRLFDCRNPLLFLWLQYFLLRFSLQQRCFIACHCHHLLLCREYLRAHFSVLSYSLVSSWGQRDAQAGPRLLDINAARFQVHLDISDRLICSHSPGWKGTGFIVFWWIYKERIYLKSSYKSCAYYEAQFLKWEEGVTSREKSGRALKLILQLCFKYT